MRPLPAVLALALFYNLAAATLGAVVLGGGGLALALLEWVM